MRGKCKIGIALVMFVVIVGMVLSGCGQTTQTATTQAATTQTSPFIGSPDETYIMVTFLSGIEYWKGCYKGFQDAAKIYGVKTEYTGANQYDVNQEVTVLEQVISKKPAGIAVTCMDPDGLVAPIQKAKEQGIPIVTFDADAPTSGRYSTLLTGNENAGVIAARTLAKLIGEEGEVGMLQVPGQLNLELRGKGFIDTIAKEFPKIKLVQVGNGKIDQAVSAQVSASIIQSNPNIKGFFASDAAAGVGCATAVKEANKVGAIKIVSFDTDKGTLDLIKEGVIDASIAQGTWNMGFWSLNFMYFLNHNLINPVENWKDKGINPLPPSVDTGVNVVTKDNVESFYVK
ncbi:MAG: substrate-binding domain-containing protein [Candidatus Humimicrobiaceae bacterium]